MIRSGMEHVQKAIGLKVMLALLALLLVVPSMVHGASPMVPDYELKVFLDPDVVLDQDRRLKQDVITYFQMPSTVEKLAVQFMDTEDLDLNDEGWAVRIRKKEEYTDSEFQLTYKKRYPIVNGDINAALDQAEQEGFDASDTNYEAQVDWGYAKQTLSISRKKKITRSGYEGMELPTRKDSREWTIDEAPGKFEDWGSNNWGTDHLEDVHKPFGPVKAKRHIGTWEGLEIYVEVWQMLNENGTGFDYVVEASFKTPSYATAAAKKTQLEQEMSSEGWFLAQDQLKTQMILERY